MCSQSSEDCDGLCWGFWKRQYSPAATTSGSGDMGAALPGGDTAAANGVGAGSDAAGDVEQGVGQTSSKSAGVAAAHVGMRVVRGQVGKAKYYPNGSASMIAFPNGCVPSIACLFTTRTGSQLHGLHVRRSNNLGVAAVPKTINF